MAPTTCTMGADFFLPDGRPFYRLALEIFPVLDFGATVLSGESVGGSVTYYTDTVGHVDVPLAQGGAYLIRLSYTPDIRHKITVPASASANLLDYLYPHISTIDLSEASYSLDVGEEVSLDVIATYSDGETEDVTHAATIVSGDDLVASVEGSTLSGVSAGSTTVSVSSVNDDKLTLREDLLESPFVHDPTPYSLGSPKTVVVA